ncbi:MAG: adenine phosphoribosyltransferase [Candidatus Aminicenantes bacterium]|nr:adenine phosphoribosyltransferase [Candidatus Aminicenantes bacterium]
MLDRLKKKIIEVKDFPKPGIGFKDITPLVEDAESFKFIVDQISDLAKKKGAKRIVSIESRGFIFGGPVAYKLDLGMSIIRKKGKLPRECVCVKAPNEYAVEYFEIHKDSVRPGEKVIIIDDLIATGSSSISAVDLIKKIGGDVVGFAALIELSFLKGKETILAAHPDIEVMTLIRF